jgi:dTDP-4-dehydrorhamnose reductase
MRILVTGVTGQVGSALVAKLAATGTVVAADRAALDLSRPADLPARLDALAPDLIINPAAYTAVDRAEDERKLAFTVNAEAPEALARWAADRAVPLVHFSTDYVFGGQGDHPWLESDPPQALSAYGASKLAGEDAIRAVGGAHLIVRTSWVYAARGTNFLRTIARLARERQELRIVDQFGAPTSAAIIADAVSAIVARPNLAAAFSQTGGLLHLSASGTTSWHGFATAIVEGLRKRGLPLAVERVLPIATGEYPVKATRPLNSRLDLSRLARTFGIVPPSWTVGLDIELSRFVVQAD